MGNKNPKLQTNNIDNFCRWWL